jgi:gas vesicle protein
VLRRAFWLGLGVGLGGGASFWLTRWVRDTAARYAPERVSSDLAEAVKGFGRDVRDAVAEGRDAMRERETDLRKSVYRRN